MYIEAIYVTVSKARGDFMFTNSAINAIQLLSNQPYANQINNTSQNTTNDCNEVLNTTLEKNDVVSRLQSFGLPMRVKDMPRNVSCFSELAHGLTIAPSALNRMKHDEAYLLEVEEQIHYWFFVHVPAREREAALLGEGYSVFAEFTIKPDGEVVKSSVIINNNPNEPLEAENPTEPINNNNVLTDYSTNVDASIFSAFVGNILQTERKKD